jgi:hypothetical protein
VTRSRETRWGGFLALERRGEGRGGVWGAPGVIGVAFIEPGEGTERGGQSNGGVNSHEGHEGSLRLGLKGIKGGE